MPKFAANLTMLFTELPFLERFNAARKAGFRAVEFLFPYEYAINDIKSLLIENNLQAVLFNLPAGDWAAGERGIAADPGRKEEFRAGVRQAVEWADQLNVPRLNCLAGKMNQAFSREEHWQTLIENVRYAAQALAGNDLKLMIEPINHYDVPGFFLNTTRQALQLINEVNMPNVYLQYDLYHAQKEEGNLTVTLRENIQRVGHIQIADNPGRHQPGTGEINYPFLLREIDNLGYEGYVSLEYIPEPDTLNSLGWITAYGYNLE
ncbi:MAG: hydroxypyruvate isomerase [Moorella sp. (in: firmicutes)]|jgi:hydroxypyruvate isomerase|uniref:hydroxypyruvate isomerase n=1 Tax=unclassified Neomoorella TaxID=2676739 RepID=UPI0010FFB878|nr:MULTISPECIES: hydroxypyruvate isomerase [unclassified Moorella (in: firmicutes)]MDK2817694.1 hydroxypyruvate isomerase [Moorella sp. (in: firmicutes)]GEA16498.1 hydroxypyruvate isomerase [Moorella sp. E308F]GEA17323.1 hydroxypyruvate isomerase [Moorella sp. E306M]